MLSPSIAQNHNTKALQLACKQAIYGFTKIPHIFPIEYNVCTNKLLVAVGEQSDLYMAVTTKAFLVATTR